LVGIEHKITRRAPESIAYRDMKQHDQDQQRSGGVASSAATQFN